MTRPERLMSELHAYQPVDAAEEVHRGRMLELLAGTEDVFSRDHFAPGHFTASCYIIDDAGRLLLHHHRRLDRWLQMGGHVEADELPDAAALREGQEESGLRDLADAAGGVFDLDIHPIPAAKGEPEHAHFDIRYLARTGTPETAQADRAESNALAWVTLDRAAELMPGPESLRVIRKIERLWRGRSLV
jgi:8-oxo-dGTP pyrophosphatase MutT (NUDIX family)